MGFENLRGIMGSLFQLGGPSGAQLKSESAGTALASRDNADAAYQVMRAAPPVGNNDAVTLAYMLATKNLYIEDWPANHGLVEWDGNPAYFVNSQTLSSGVFTLVRFVPFTGGLISNIWIAMNSVGNTLTAATTTGVTGAANNGSGAIRLAVTSSASFATNDVITVSGVTGTTEANGAWVMTVIDGTHIDLVGSTFTNPYTAGGTVTRSANCAAIYDSAGNFVSCTGDQVAAWTGATGVLSMALATPKTLTAGQNYYVGLLSVGTTPVGVARGVGGTAIDNAGTITGANLRFATNSSGLTKLKNAITPGTNSVTSSTSMWMGLN